MACHRSGNRGFLESSLSEPQNGDDLFTTAESAIVYQDHP